MILYIIFTIDKLTEEHKTTLEKYKSLIHFSLNKIGLTSLENFPKLDDAEIVSINIFIYYIFIYRSN